MLIQVVRFARCIIAEKSAFIAADALSLADVALVAYTRMAHEGGFDLDPYPAIRRWIARVEDGLGIGPYTRPS